MKRATLISYDRENVTHQKAKQVYNQAVPMCKFRVESNWFLPPMATEFPSGLNSSRGLSLWLPFTALSVFAFFLSLKTKFSFDLLRCSVT